MAEPDANDSFVEEAEETLNRALDNYSAVFVLILLTIFVTAAVPPTSPWIAVPVALQTGTMVIALHASGVRRSRLQGISLFASVFLLIVLIAFALHHLEIAKPMFFLSMLVLTIAAMGSIILRLTKQPRVDNKTVMGALCVYMLIGLLYSTIFATFQFATGSFFANGVKGTSALFVYFSFTTLTTVGYGDFTAAQDFTRMVAISEALLGQLYLVTVVSLVVANLGQQRAARIRQEADALAERKQA